MKTMTEGFLIDMRPKQLHNKGVCGVLIHNIGTLATTFTVAGDALDDVIRFEPMPGTVRMKAGQSGALCVRVTLKKRPFLGFSRWLPFIVHVATANGQRQSLAGYLEARPLVSLKLMATSSLLLTLFGGIGFILYVL